MVSPVVPYIVWFQNTEWFWLAATHGYSRRETKQRSAESRCCVSRSCKNTRGLREKWRGNAPILAAGPDLVWLQLHNRTQSEQHQMASVNSLDVNWKRSHCALHAVQCNRSVDMFPGLHVPPGLLCPKFNLMLTHNLDSADRDTLVGPIVVVPLCTMLLRRT